MDSTNVGTTSNDPLQAENARLRARLRELEDELSRTPNTRRTSPRQEEVRDLACDLPSHARDEANRLSRGLTFAFVEQMRASADVVGAVAEEVFRRTSAEPMSSRRTSTAPRSRTTQRVTREERFSDEGRRESVRALDREGHDLARRSYEMAEDVAGGIVIGIHESFDIPRRVIERFNEVMNEPQEPGPSMSSRAEGVRSDARSETKTKVEHETESSGGTGRTQVKKETEYKSETKKS